jgi:hypothetical protein
MVVKTLSIDCQCPTCGAVLEGEIPAVIAGMIATVGVKATCTACGTEGVVKAKGREGGGVDGTTQVRTVWG